MQIHEAAENYLECILMLSRKNGQVRSIDIANYLGVTKPTVSYTMKQFRENGYIDVDAHGCITLSLKALPIAERTYERHVVIAKMLMALGVQETTAYADACKIEHDISDESFACIKAYCAQKTEG
ncbi:MAG: metal-dependent transcriptional regulator [Christensenellaceae bacterium]|jgi:Mn-dependent DtxR family transcriptional regulator|nr:metal-dependent transcriptional regulator [Christensenellaceae bacterium]